MASKDRNSRKRPLRVYESPKLAARKEEVGGVQRGGIHTQ